MKKQYNFSKRSLDFLVGIHPDLVNFMKELIKISPYDFRITDGVRTAEQQNKIYQQGRTIIYDKIGKKLPKISWCDGYIKKSKHQVKTDGYGYAIDIAVLLKVENKIVAKWDYKYYKDIYEAAKRNGLIDKYNIVWGGNWQQVDSVHFQLGNADNIEFKRS